MSSSKELPAPQRYSSPRSSRFLLNLGEQLALDCCKNFFSHVTLPFMWQDFYLHVVFCYHFLAMEQIGHFLVQFLAPLIARNLLFSLGAGIAWFLPVDGHVVILMSNAQSLAVCCKGTLKRYKRSDLSDTGGHGEDSKSHTWG